MPDPGFVYVMATEGGYRKIGVSSDPARRLVGVQNGCPTNVFLEGMWSHKDPFSVEKQVHKALHLSRASGEWFKIERAPVFEAILAALRSVPGGLLDYGDTFYFDNNKGGVGAPLKLTGKVLDAARAAWNDPSLSSKQAVDRVREETGIQISARTLFAKLGTKVQPIRIAPQRTDQRKLIGPVLDAAIEAWADPRLTAAAAAAKVYEVTGVKVSDRLLFTKLGNKSHAEMALLKPPMPKPSKPKRKAKPKRRKAQQKGENQ